MAEPNTSSAPVDRSMPPAADTEISATPVKATPIPPHCTRRSRSPSTSQAISAVITGTLATMKLAEPDVTVRSP
jgi:hypothetical protein